MDQNTSYFNHEADSVGSESVSAGLGQFPIAAELMNPWLEDNAEFLKCIEGWNRDIEPIIKPLREAMLEKGFIRQLDGEPAGQIGAVDSADVEVRMGDISTLLVQALRLDSEDRIAWTKPIRITSQNFEGFSHMRPMLRLYGECSLLAGVEELTICDNSFWSLLMEANKAITAYHNLPSIQDKEPFSPFMDRLFGDENLFYRAIINPNVVAISKTATSRGLAHSRAYGSLIPGEHSDRVLLTMVLDEGEYTKPVKLTELTDGAFGVEKRLFDDTTRESLKCHYTGDVQVSFFRPWPHQRAYRIEVNCIIGDNIESLESLLRCIKAETQFIGVLEPRPQYLVDLLAKQVSSIATLYGDINLHRFQNLGFPNRTSQI